MTTWLLSWQGLLDCIWLAFLLSMLRHFLRSRQLLAQTKFWLITIGRITIFEWVRQEQGMWPRVTYTYQVFDQDFQGEHLFLDTMHNNPNSRYARKVAYRVAMAYEHDETIDVFYNPNNPQQAALDITMPRKLNIIIGLLLLLIILHLVIIIGRLL